MANYTTLVADKTTEGSIKNWINNSTIPSTTVLQEAEQYIYRRLRVREMLTTVTGTIAADALSLTAPSGFLASRQLLITGVNSAEIDRATAEDVRRAWSYDGDGNRITGKPLLYWDNKAALYFDYKSDQAYPYDLLYYETPEALSGSNLTNFLTDDAPYLLRCACMSFANDFMKDDGERDRWLIKANNEIEILNEESDFSMRDTNAVVQVI